MSKSKPSTKQTPNDQGKIIKALRNKDYASVWEEVKWIGTGDMADISERRIIFDKCVLAFDPYINNNFILYYKKRLKWNGYSNNVECKLASSRRISEELKRQYISPTDKTSSKITEELKKWRY